MQWPEWVKREINSSSNRTGTLTKSDLEIVEGVVGWPISVKKLCSSKTIATRIGSQIENEGSIVDDAFPHIWKVELYNEYPITLIW